jgi:transglutaminase-like putative cysteine protease
MGMEMIPMSREQALAELEPAQAFDLLSFFAVELKTAIPHPTTLSYLKLSLENISTDDLDLDDDFQHVRSDDPLVVESFRAQIDDLPDYSLPISEHTTYLEPSVYIQCQNEEIIAAARDIVGDETNARRAAEKLVHGVYRLVKKNPTASLPSALDVLRTKEGDCNEHSILFTALARAVGLPTKIYVGLVNLDGSSYFYHAWCAVWLGKWVPVDPTFDQFPADVGHLKLKEGELAEQAKVLQVVGKLRISVLEYVPQ